MSGDGEEPTAPVEEPTYKLVKIGGEGGPADLKEVDPETKVVLTADGTQYVVARLAAKKIPIVAKVLESFDKEDGKPNPEGEGDEKHLGQVTEIPLPVVKGETAAAIIEFVELSQLEEAKETPEKLRNQKPLRGKIEDVCPKWALDFVKAKLIKDGDEKEHAQLFDILAAAHALEVQELEDLCGLTAASILKGKSPEEMRELFGIDCDFLPEETEKISDDCKWTRDQ